MEVKSLSDCKIELGLLAARILSLIDSWPSQSLQTSQICTEKIISSRLKNAIKERRIRSNYFDSILFSEPAWDILLDLALAKLENRNISVSSLCIASGVPTTTALRWIKILIENNHIVRSPDPNDGRRHYVSLSEKSYEKIVAIIISTNAKD